MSDWVAPYGFRVVAVICAEELRDLEEYLQSRLIVCYIYLPDNNSGSLNLMRNMRNKVAFGKW